MAEHSFDIVSKTDRQELNNAIDAAKKEIATRFDFKGAIAEIKLEKDSMALEASDDMRMKQLIDLFQSKMIKRGLSIKAFQFGKFETNVTGLVKCKVDIQAGLSMEQTKKITKLIKESNLKVQSQIQGDQVRVTSKSIDQLQELQKKIKDANLDFDASFSNYR